MGPRQAINCPCCGETVYFPASATVGSSRKCGTLRCELVFELVQSGTGELIAKTVGECSSNPRCLERRQQTKQKRPQAPPDAPSINLIVNHCKIKIDISPIVNNYASNTKNAVNNIRSRVRRTAISVSVALCIGTAALILTKLFNMLVAM